MDRIHYLMLRRRTLTSLRGLRMIFTLPDHGMTEATQISLIGYLQAFLMDLRGSYYDNSTKHKTPSSWSEDRDGLLFHDWMAFLIQRHGPGVFSHLPGHGKTDIVRAAARQVMEDARETEDQNDPNENIMRAIRTIGRR